MTSKALKLACCECAHPIIYRRIKVSLKVTLSYEIQPCMTNSRKAISYATLVKTTPKNYWAYKVCAWQTQSYKRLLKGICPGYLLFL